MVPCGLSLNLSPFGLGPSSIGNVSNLCLSSNKTFLLFFSLSFYFIYLFLILLSILSLSSFSFTLFINICALWMITSWMREEVNTCNNDYLFMFIYVNSSIVTMVLGLRVQNENVNIVCSHV
jgi:hypothetical protein